MTWVYSVAFAPFTVTSQTSQLTGYEAVKLAIYDEHSYLRSWRSNNSLAAQTITLTFAAPVTLAGIALFHFNGPSFQLKKSTNSGSTYTDLVTGSGSFTDRYAELYLGYRRYFTPLVNANNITNIQVRILAQTPVDNAAYLELGSVIPLTSLIEFPRPPRRGMQERPVRAYDESGLRKRAAGPWRVEMDWDVFLRDPTHVETWRNIAMVGEDNFFVIAKANAITPQAYLMRSDGPMQFEDHKTFGRVSARWIELA